MSQACRGRIGDEVELFDGEGRSVAARVVAIDRAVVDLEAAGRLLIEPPPALALTLATAVPKGDRLGWLVEKATELGVARLAPILTRRSVVEPRSTKIGRLRRTVIEASKQCGRNRLMELDEPVPWQRIAADDRSALRLIAHPRGVRFSNWPPIAGGGKAVLAIGPEGGFTDDELDSAVSLGWRPISLGRSILRIETAGIVGAAAVFARALGYPVHSPPDLS